MTNVGACGTCLVVAGRLSNCLAHSTTAWTCASAVRRAGLMNVVQANYALDGANLKRRGAADDPLKSGA